MVARLTSALSLVLGIVMTGMGSFVVIRFVVLRWPPLSGSAVLDTLFAVFFIVRGVMYLRRFGNPPATRGPGT